MPRPLDDVKLVFLDMDGVLYKGERPIGRPGPVIERLREKIGKVLFTTNNATLDRDAYVKKLRRMGVYADRSEIITSAYAVALYLKRMKRATVFPVGERGLINELRAAKVRMTRTPEQANCLVVGLDRKLTYAKIALAARTLFAGARFVATNADRTYPTEKGLMPGAGAVIGAISGCTGREPDIIIGKPSTYMLELGLRIAGVRKKETVVIGDRLDTDIVAARKLGVRSILVLSGVTRRADLAKSSMKPDFVFNNLAEVVN